MTPGNLAAKSITPEPHGSGIKRYKMSEEKEDSTPTPPEKPVTPKPSKFAALKKPAFNPLAPKHHKFLAPKSGKQSYKGAIFKGGGVKKGK